VTKGSEPHPGVRFGGLFEFSRRRWRAFATILALIYLLAILGPWVAIFIPLLGGPLFLAGLMIWFVPGVLFGWTGLFEFHEFGAHPANWAGHLVMLAFYAAIAGLLSWPFRRDRMR
jgi:hypothetical protein